MNLSVFGKCDLILPNFSGDKFRVAFVDREEKFLNQQRDLDAVNARLECELVKVISEKTCINFEKMNLIL